MAKRNLTPYRNAPATDGNDWRPRRHIKSTYLNARELLEIFGGLLPPQERALLIGDLEQMARNLLKSPAAGQMAKYLYLGIVHAWQFKRELEGDEPTESDENTCADHVKLLETIRRIRTLPDKAAPTIAANGKGAVIDIFTRERREAVKRNG